MGQIRIQNASKYISFYTKTHLQCMKCYTILQQASLKDYKAENECNISGNEMHSSLCKM